MNRGKKTSFIKWMINVNIGSIALVGLLMAITIGIFISIRTNNGYKNVAAATSVNVAHTLESLSDADFTYDETTGILKKGDIVITDEAFHKSLAYDESIHHTIFWGDTRVLTDVTDDKGQSVVGTKLTDQTIINTVKKEGIYNTNNVTIYGAKYTVCYYPIKNGNEIVGYVFTGVNQSESLRLITKNVALSIAITVLLAATIIVIVFAKVKKKSVGFNDQLNSVSSLAIEKKNAVSILGQETNENMNQINVAIGQMSQAVAQQANQTEVIMGSMQEFGNNIDVITSQVASTADVTRSSTSIIEAMEAELAELEQASKASSEEIANIISQIDDDQKAVGSISQIAKAINDIAFQITILSFNAAVEAARAGEAGKGFAVVADSIKDLSDKAQASVNDIAAIIHDVNEKMATTATASQKLIAKNDDVISALAVTKEKTGLLTDAFDRIAENVASVQNESAAITIAKNRVIDTVASLTAVSQENAAMSEEIDATSNNVIITTEGLLEEIEKLQAITETIEQVKNDFI